MIRNSRQNPYWLDYNEEYFKELIQKNTSLDETVAKFTKEQIGGFQSPPISTGFDNLDYLLGGGITPGLTVLGAVSSLGKSTLALQMAENMSEQGIMVLFFSMEMTKERIASKAISRQMFLDEFPDLNQNKTDKNADNNVDISPELIQSIQSDEFFHMEKTDKFTEEMWQNVHKAVKTVEKRTKNLYIIEGNENIRSGWDIFCYVENFVKNYMGDKIPLVVMVDYLQILTSANDKAIPKAVVDENIQKLKSLTKLEGFNIPVIVISSVNRENYNKPIAFESFKESGNIEYTADEVLGLQFCAAREANGRYFDMNAEKATFPRRVEVVVLKQRYRQCNGMATFDYYAKFDCFVEKQTEEEPSVIRRSNGKVTRQNDRRVSAENKEPEAETIEKKATEMSREEFEAWLKEKSRLNENGADKDNTHQQHKNSK